MWDVCTNTSTTGQRKNTQGPRMQTESSGLKECHYTSRFVQRCFSRDLDQQRLSQRRRKHSLLQRRDAKHSLSQRRNTEQQGKGKGWLQNFARHELKISRVTQTVSTDSRAHGVFSTSEKKRCCVCVATSQRLAVTTRQPSAYGWAESPKQHVLR